MINLSNNPLQSDRLTIEYLIKSKTPGTIPQIVMTHGEKTNPHLTTVYVNPNKDKSEPKEYKFSNSTEANETLGNMPPDDKTSFGKWYKKLTQDRIKAIQAYTGWHYASINGILRGTLDESKLGKIPIPIIKKLIPVLTQALDSFVLEKPMTVYRTMDKKDIGLFQNSPIIKDMGFVSTTLIKNSYLPKKYQMQGCIEISIKLPPGKGVGAWISPISRLKRENEFLLNRGAEFKVHSVKTTETGYAVELEWLGNDSTQITKSITDFSELDNLPQPNINREYKFSWDENDLKTFKSTEELEQWKKHKIS